MASIEFREGVAAGIKLVAKGRFNPKVGKKYKAKMARKKGLAVFWETHKHKR